MSERAWTLMELLNTVSGYFEEKGIESPRRNAEALLGKVLGLPRIQLYIQHDRPLTEEQVGAFRELTRRRVRHEPLQLLLGTVEFFGVKLEVVPGLLIPRPETEELAERVASEIMIHFATHPPRVLDLGCGTGCLSVAIAAKAAQATVDAVDLDFEAVRCTERNAELNGVAARVNAIRADILGENFLSHVQGPYDVVISNPPYVTEADWLHLAPEVRDHESRRALVAGENGYAFYQRIADLLPALLKPGGLAAFEIGAGQSSEVRRLFQPTLSPIEVHADLAGIPRIVMGYQRQESLSNIMP